MASVADLNRGIALAHAALVRRLPRFEAVHAAAIRSLGQLVAAEITRSLTAAAWTGPEPEALTAELRRRLDAQWVGKHTGSIERVRAEAMRTTIKEIGAGLGISFDLTNPMIDGALRKIRNRTDLSDDSWDLVRDSLQDSFDAGHGEREAARDLRTKVEGMAPARARTIARTEMTAISNNGAVMSMRLSGAAEWKTWLASNDARTRDWHANASGQTRKLDDTFSVGGEELDYPGDPSGSTRNVANCRCAVAAADGPDGPELTGLDFALIGSAGCGCGG